MASIRPWTFVVSEYLDLPFLLRKSGNLVVSVRSAQEALDYLRHSTPSQVVIDPSCVGVEAVYDFVSRHCPDSVIRSQDEVISDLLKLEYSVRGA